MFVGLDTKTLKACIFAACLFTADLGFYRANDYTELQNHRRYRNKTSILRLLEFD